MKLPENNKFKNSLLTQSSQSLAKLRKRNSGTKVTIGLNSVYKLVINLNIKSVGFVMTVIVVAVVIAVAHNKDFVCKAKNVVQLVYKTYPSLNLRLRATALFFIISDISRPPELSPSEAEAISGSIFKGSLNWAGGLPKFVRLRTKLTASLCCADDDDDEEEEEVAFVVVADLLRFETVACLDDLRRFFNSLLKSMGIKPTQPDLDFKIPPRRGASFGLRFCLLDDDAREKSTSTSVDLCEVLKFLLKAFKCYLLKVALKN
ncbi:hypothetical protein FF38_07055 [Lucilia cuprina]|uniref:Uncharacterized protein n=1 Tax=Lucilia cuprina TaxID=7375 RepID=A0A0L0CH09_LUCCU|nr:hypothetical protein FF38_07055 [Lucilia cuprina]